MKNRANVAVIWMLFLSVMLALPAGCGGSPDEAERLEAARAFHTEGQYRSAMIELKNLLRSNPDNADARLLLGLVALDLGDAASAEKELRRASELGVQRAQWLVPMGMAYVGLRQYQRALDEIAPTDAGDEAERTSILVVRGDAHAGLGDLNLAEESYNAALDASANDLRAMLGLASLSRERGDPEKALEELQRAAQAHPDSERPLVAQGRLLLSQARFEDASGAFRLALERISEEGATATRFDALAGLAEASLGSEDVDGAIGAVEQLADVAPNHPLTEFLRARITFDQRDFETAQGHLANVLSRVPDYPPARMLHGAVSLALGDYAQAEMYLSGIVAENPTNLEARKMLASARLGLAQPADAVAALLPALDGTADDGAVLAMIARASLRAGDREAGIEYFEKSAAADPDNPQLQMELAAGYLAAGRAADAVALLQRLEQTEGIDPLRREMLLVLALVRDDRMDEARKLTEDLLAANPESAVIYSLAGGVEMSTGDSAAARRHFESALARDPDTAASVVNLARLDIQDGKPDDARARLERLLDENPGDMMAQMALAQLAIRTGDSEAATKYMEAARASNPGSVQPRLELAKFYLGQAKLTRASAVAAEAVGIQPENPRAHNYLGLALMGLGQSEAAMESFRRALQVRPDWVEALFNLGRVQLLVGRPVESRENMDRILALEPEHVGAAAMLSTMELQRGNTAHALELALELEKRHPANPVPQVLVGDVQVVRRKFDEAVTAYTAALERGGDRNINAKLYQALQAKGEQNPERVLTDWLERFPADVPTRLLLAQAWQNNGDADAAQAEYRKILDSQPDNPVALNNLAWMYADTDREQAIQLAESALAAAPGAGAIADTLGWLLVKDGQLQKAVGTLRNALDAMPDSPEVSYHLSVALARTGREEEARLLLEKTLAKDVSFDSRDDARRLLDEL